MFVFARSVPMAAIAAIIILSYSCGEKKEAAKAPAASGPTIVDVIIAKPQSISDTIEANGTVLANDYVELHPEVGGRLTHLDVPEGKFITKGTIIARVNDADLEAQIEK